MSTIHAQTSQALGERRADLAQAIVARQYEQQPEMWKPYGSPGWEKSVRDTNWHLSYLAEAVAAGDPSLFADYAAWVKVLLAGLGFADEALIQTLTCTRRVVQEQLPDDQAALVAEYVDVGLRQVQETPVAPPSFLDNESPLTGLARQYLDALLAGERHTASRLILEAVERGVTVQDLYLDVFQRTQREIGRLWQMNRVTVAQEHYCTAATQLVMSQLYPYIFATDRSGHRLVAACVGGELHELGVRMVADFFEMEGWDTYYLGANAPAETVVQALAARQADVLAVSATMTFHVRAVADLIAQVRASGAEVKILVGGYPFNVSDRLWREVGGDGGAGNAQEAISVAQRLVAERGGGGA